MKFFTQRGAIVWKSLGSTGPDRPGKARIYLDMPGKLELAQTGPDMPGMAQIYPKFPGCVPNGLKWLE